MTHTFNVLPTRPDDGVAEILIALGQARIDVQRVVADEAGFVVSVEEPADTAMRILEAMGFRLGGSAVGRIGSEAA